MLILIICLNRYDFSKVCRWFAERSDLILLLFDSYKLDISDEFKGVIEELHGHDDKVHCVLNKADQLDQESLMRVYGALLWSMGKIFRGAEVTRVYVGSFNNEPLQKPEYEKLFEKDRNALMGQLKELPKMCGMRKVNEMVKRIRLNIVNVCIIGHIKSKMPWLWGKEAVQRKLLDSIPEIYAAVQHEYSLSAGDFPPADQFRASLQLQDFSSFPHVDRRALRTLKQLLDEDIPQILQQIAGVSRNTFSADDASSTDSVDGSGAKSVSESSSSTTLKIRDEGMLDSVVNFARKHELWVNFFIISLAVTVAALLLRHLKGANWPLYLDAIMARLPR